MSVAPPRIRLGILGMGSVAQAVHLPLLARRADLFEVAAICDVAESVVHAMGDRHGIARERRFTDYDAMLAAGGIDAVLLLQRGSHARTVLAAWDHGLAVLSEKPLAYTTAEIDDLAACQPDLGHPAILVGYMKQYDSAVEAAVEVVAEVDDVRSVEVTVLHPPGGTQLEFVHVVGPAGPLPADATGAFDAEDVRLRVMALGDVDDDLWRAYRGSLVHSLAHDLSVMRSLGTIPASVEHADIWRQSSAHQIRPTGRDTGSFGPVPPSISATGALEAGGRFRLAWHYLPDFPAYRETVRLIHGAGTVELVFPSPYLMHAPTELTVSSLDGDAERRVLRRSGSEAFERQLEAFAAMIHDGVPPRSGLDGGRADVRDCQRIIAAYAQRRGIAVGGEVGALVSASAEVTA